MDIRVEGDVKIFRSSVISKERVVLVFVRIQFGEGLITSKTDEFF